MVLWGRFGSVSLACMMELALLVVLVSGPVASATSTAITTETAAEIPELPFSNSERYYDPSLNDVRDRTSILVAMDAGAPPSEVARHLDGVRVVPAIGGVQMMFGMASGDGIAALHATDSVYALLENKPTPLQLPRKPGLDRLAQMPFGSLRLAEPVDIDEVFDRSSLTGGPEVTMREVVEFTGARRAWEDLGVDGDGITIAVVDTGVDFGAFTLGDSAVDRMANGLPSSFDPDGTTFAYTTIQVQNYTLGPAEFVDTTGTDPLIYVFDIFAAFPGGFGPKAVYWSDLFGGPFPVDMEITGLPPSQSGAYRFGVLFQWNFGVDLFPILLVDTVTAGVYDTIYLDISFDWVLQGFGFGLDFSFSDEPALVPAGGNVVAARDMDGDGYVDISAGIPAHVLDIFGFHPRVEDMYTVIPPIDAAGDVVGFVYDWQGHGTSVASSAAGRDTSHPVAGPGIAPGASIMGIPALTWGNVIEGWLWSAGFDLVGTADFSNVDNYGFAYGEWRYTGNHRADIISNSWGISDWVTWRLGQPWPWYDVLTILEDVLMVPGYADPAYPGTLMVHAGGNGASGYGTMTDPGYNTLALTVGASTSLNYTGLPTAGHHNDIISWSARGPTSSGMLKPDIVQVGAFAWAAAPVWLWPFVGGSGGFDSYTLFGGTSQATPVASGSAAVAMEAYEQATGSAPEPFLIKAILKSTAIDLGYDAFLQGAGHVNVYNAASLALGMSGILVTSPATWDNARRFVNAPYAAASAQYGREIAITPPSGSIRDTSWYAGSVRPGASTTAEFTIEAPMAASGTVSSVWHSRVSTISLSGTTRVLGFGWLEGFGEILRLSPGDIPAGADLMVVRSAMSFSSFDSEGDYVWNNRSRVIVADWVDADGDANVALSELFTFNYGYNTGTTSEARVGLPDGRFQGSPVVWFSQAPAAGRIFASIPFEITVEFYDRVPWSWVSLPSSFSASPGSPSTFVAQLEVPSSANAGVYQGQIFVSPVGGNPTAIPVSVVVPTVIDDATLFAPLTFPDSTHVYDPSMVTGMFDWRWRYEAGDWKLWFVEVADPSTIALQVRATWSGARTDIDIASIGPNAVFSDSTVSPFLGSGRFRWQTRSGVSEDWVSVPTSSGVEGSATGVYGFALHSVLFEGTGTSEAVTGTVGAVKLTPRGPVTVVTTPGETVTVPFTLSTGFDLSSVTFYPVAPTRFLLSTQPAFTPALPQGESLALWATIAVPVETPDGVYAHHVLVAADEFATTAARINVVVDSTGPGVTILSPGASAYTSGTVMIQAAVSDTNGIEEVTFDTVTASGPMVREPISGFWFAAWDTTSESDGMSTVTVTARDIVGNFATTSVDVIVDNSGPAVSFSSPAPDAWVRGTVTLEFLASDPNLDTAILTYAGTSTEVTDATSLAVDTRVLGDGPWTFTLTATDFAGNTGTATRTLKVDNTAPIVRLVAPGNGAHVRATVEISFVIEEANVASATLTVGAGAPLDVAGQSSRSVDTTAITDGTRNVVVAATDRAGNSASDSRSVTIDNTAPVVSFTSPAAGIWVRGNVNLQFGATDANLDKATLAYPGGSANVKGQTSHAVDTAAFGDGTWTFTLTATDLAGNAATATRVLNVDNTAPIVGLVTPAAAAYLRGTVAFTFVIEETNVATATLTIGSGSPLDVAGLSTKSVDTTSVQDGTRVVVVTATDRAGNSATDFRSVTIDNTAPVVSIQTPANGRVLRGNTVITFTATDANMELVELIIDGRSRDADSGSVPWDTNEVGDGDHEIVVRARDRAGNVAEGSVDVSTDNVAQARQQSLNNGLINGLVIALVVGFLLGFILGRRRKPSEEGAEPSRVSEPAPEQPESEAGKSEEEI